MIMRGSIDFRQLQSGKLVNEKDYKADIFTPKTFGVKEVCFAPSFAIKKQSLQCV